MGSELRVGDIMTKKVITISYQSSVMDAAKLMKQHDIGSIIIVEDNHGKKAKGILTERDIVHKVIAKGDDPSKTMVEKIMSKPLRVIKPTTSLEEAAKAMKKNRVKRLPVVNDSNELVGILSEGDIMRVFPAIIDMVEEHAKLS